MERSSSSTKASTPRPDHFSQYSLSVWFPIQLCFLWRGTISWPKSPLHRSYTFYLTVQIGERLSPWKSVIYWPLTLTNSSLSLLSLLFLIALSLVMWVRVPDAFWFYKKKFFLAHFPCVLWVVSKWRKGNIKFILPYSNVYFAF